MKKEFCVLEDTPIDTQKKIRTWVTSGYEIEIVAQSVSFTNDVSTLIVTSLWRIK